MKNVAAVFLLSWVAAYASAQDFVYPGSVAIDGSGNIYVADKEASAVFKVSADGKVSVLARGSPLKNPTGIAIEPSGGVVVVDPHVKALFRIGSDGNVSVIYQGK